MLNYTENLIIYLKIYIFNMFGFSFTTRLNFLFKIQHTKISTSYIFIFKSTIEKCYFLMNLYVHFEKDNNSYDGFKDAINLFVY